MVTKGIVINLNPDNTIKVRIPLFESPGNMDYQILDCTICHNPGNTNGYKIDDVVWIGFEDNKINKPVVLGKLYIGNEEATSYHYLDSLEVTNKAILPANTKIGSLDFEYFKELGQKIDQINTEPQSYKVGDIINLGYMNIIKDGSIYDAYFSKEISETEFKTIPNNGVCVLMFNTTCSLFPYVKTQDNRIALSVVYDDAGNSTLVRAKTKIYYDEYSYKYYISVKFDDSYAHLAKDYHLTAPYGIIRFISL